MSDPWQNEIRRLLCDAYAQRSGRNRRYSLRAFSKSLGIGSAALSEFLNGRRRISVRYAARLLERAGVAPEVATPLLEKGRVKRAQPRAFGGRTAVVMDHYQLISGWQHFAILSLAETEGFSGTVEEIRERLGLSRRAASEAAASLVRLGLMKRDGRGRLVATGEQYVTSDGISNEWIRKAHRDTLACAERSLAADPVEARDFISVTMALDPARLAEFRQLVRRFVQEASDTADAGAKRQVYRLAVQLFPLSDRMRETDDRH